MGFVTTYRRGVFTNAMQKCCEQIMRDVCVDFEAELREFNGEPVGSAPIGALPTESPTIQAGCIKGVSGRLLRKEFDPHVRRYLWGGQFWSGSYFAGSCGGAPLTVVRQCIENQQRPYEQGCASPPP